MITVQHAADCTLPVEDGVFCSWINMALDGNTGDLTLRFVTPDEIRELNHSYRHLDKPTNVLAFPFGPLPAELASEISILGDIILCPAIIEQEALRYQRAYTAHLAHITIHGTLHLLGYDHSEDRDTLEMQTLETGLLLKLGFANPYPLEEPDFE